MKTGKNRWTRKTIALPGCEPFPALADMGRPDKWGRFYTVSDSMGMPIYPECIQAADPKFKAQYLELEKEFGTQ